MPISNVTDGTLSVVTNGATSPGAPSDLAVGDWMTMIDVVWRSGTASTPAIPGTPAGWTRKSTDAAILTEAALRITLYYRKYASGDSMPSVSYSGNSGDVHATQIVKLRGGVASGDPTDVLGPISTGNSSATLMGPISGLSTAAADGSLVLVICANENDADDGSTVGTLSGDSLTWTELEEYGTSPGADFMYVLDYAITAGPKSITSKSFSYSGPRPVRAYGRMWAIASEPPGPVVDAGPDVESQATGAELTRTATADQTISTWEWTITAGPTGVGTTIGTAATLAWTPTLAGNYTLQAAGTNADGETGTDTFTVTVYEPSATGEYSLFSNDGPPTTANAGSFTLATEFYVTEPETYLVAIRWPRPTTGVNPTAARVETFDGSIVPGTSVTPSGSGTGWQRTDLPAPVLLTEGTRYRVLVHYLNNYPAGLVWNPQGRVNGPVTAPTNAASTAGMTTTYASGTSIATPNTTVDGLYWSDVVVEYSTSETIPVEGVGTAAAIATGDISRTRVLDAGPLVADGAASAEAIGVRTLDAAPAAADATATGSLGRVRAAIAGTAPANATATADVERLRLLAAAAPVEATAVGNLVDDDALRGVATASATGSGTLRTAMPIAGAAAGVMTGAGEGRRVTGFYETLTLDFNVVAQRLRSRNRIRAIAPVVGDITGGDVEAVGPLEGFLTVDTGLSGDLDRYLAEHMMSAIAEVEARAGARRPRFVVTTAQAYARGREAEGEAAIPLAGRAHADASAIGDVTVALPRQPAPVDTSAVGDLLALRRVDAAAEVTTVATLHLRRATALSSVVSVIDDGDPFGHGSLDDEESAMNEADVITTQAASTSEPVAEHTFTTRPFVRLRK